MQLRPVTPVAGASESGAAQGKAFDAAAIVATMRDVAGAVSHLHSAGLVHGHLSADWCDPWPQPHHHACFEPAGRSPCQHKEELVAVLARTARRSEGREIGMARHAPPSRHASPLSACAVCGCHAHEHRHLPAAVRLM